MLEREGGASEERSSSWETERAPENGDPLLIGVVSSIPDLTHTVHPFFRPVLAGLRAGLLGAGCDFLVSSRSPLAGPPDDPFGLDRWHRRGVDGLVVMGLGARDIDLRPLIEANLPLVFVDQEALGQRVGFVGSDNIEGMASAVRHLHELGRDRIATITGRLHTPLACDRLLGYRSALSSLGLEERAEYMLEGDYFHQSGYIACSRLLALGEPPNAIAAATDAMAAGAILAIQEAKLEVPADIAVTGFDDNYFASQMTPALTTVRRDAVAIGQAAAEGILNMLLHPEEPTPAVVLPTELVVRESSGARLAVRSRAKARRTTRSANR